MAMHLSVVRAGTAMDISTSYAVLVLLPIHRRATVEVRRAVEPVPAAAATWAVIHRAASTNIHSAVDCLKAPPEQAGLFLLWSPF
jgi:hypothetical protein